jgi:Zn-dependent M16 (insulinase) family peptidase
MAGSLNSFTSADLRRFYKKWYYPSNMTLYVAGVFDMEVNIFFAFLYFTEMHFFAVSK